MTSSSGFDIGLLVFPRITALDITGPFEVLARIPGARIHWIWKRVEPVTSDAGLPLQPTVDFATCPKLDVICVPGGPGVTALMEDDEVAAFGAIPDPARIVVDGKHISGGGVTAGLDFAFAVVAALAGEAKAKEIQLLLEYAPAPPFVGGTPETAEPETLAAVRAMAGPMLEARVAAVRRAAAKLAA
ncbi:MAG: DJ-1/PfpI family protein [Burkholderiales bacterium]|nr:DJ-1/PfpI family protein [Burkholderiales bacterium]